jgi:hypothetical protein
MHEVFLQRLAAHPVLRTDVNFKVFLEYEQEVTIRKCSFYVLSHLLHRVLLNGSYCFHKHTLPELGNFNVVKIAVCVCQTLLQRLIILS